MTGGPFSVAGTSTDRFHGWGRVWSPEYAMPASLPDSDIAVSENLGSDRRLLNPAPNFRHQIAQIRGVRKQRHQLSPFDYRDVLCDSRQDPSVPVW